MTSNLNLGVVGNCSYGALVDQKGRIVWCCFPRFDGDPIFHSLLGSPDNNPEDGTFAISLEGLKESNQHYKKNTAILKTQLHSDEGSVEITDFAPRFIWRDRLFHPLTLVRRIVPLSGRPRIKVQIRPRYDYGKHPMQITHGSNHIRYITPETTYRLTTDAPIDYVRNETLFNLEDPINIVFGPDETLSEGVNNIARLFEERTDNYWRSWARRLELPFEWQDTVIRAAITLKMCTYEQTGAIIAALTTSIPEAAGSARNWDYRFCWVRDAYFVVRALNSLAAVKTMENYFRWLMNIVQQPESGHLQPVFGIGLEKELTERQVDSLPGYRNMGPVRVGNQAHEHFQHDTYGNIILGATQAFFDRRLYRQAGLDDFIHLEKAGEQAFQLYNQPDAGIWELRSRARIHTSSSLMCWAACDRLAKIAMHLKQGDRAEIWKKRSHVIKEVILKEAWSDKRNCFVESFGGKDLDASVLLMAEVGFIDPKDPRFVATVDAMEKGLARGPYMMRYEAPDDFGKPETAFNICAFWRLDALARIGRKEEARDIFESLLATRNHLGLLSEDTHPETKELWGNFPQTYSMVGIINGAMRLSRSWESVV